MSLLVALLHKAQTCFVQRKFDAPDPSSNPYICINFVCLAAHEHNQEKTRWRGQRLGSPSCAICRLCGWKHKHFRYLCCQDLSRILTTLKAHCHRATPPDPLLVLQYISHQRVSQGSALNSHVKLEADWQQTTLTEPPSVPHIESPTCVSKGPIKNW